MEKVNRHCLDVARYFFAQSAFCEKIQFKAADRTRGKQKLVFWSGIVILVFTLLAWVIQLSIPQFKEFAVVPRRIAPLAAIIGTITSAASIVLQLIDRESIDSNIQQHTKFGNKYRLLRDKYVMFMQEIAIGNKSGEDLLNEMEALQKEYEAISDDAPSTESKDYDAAQKSLGVHGNDNEENTWSNDEIDRMLPIYLRLDAILNQVGTQ